MRHPLPNHFAELNLELGSHPETRPLLHCLLERIEDDWGCMAEHEWPPGQNEVDVFLAIDVPNARSLSARSNHGLSSNSAKRPYGRVHAAREELAGACHDVGRAH